MFSISDGLCKSSVTTTITSNFSKQKMKGNREFIRLFDELRKTNPTRQFVVELLAISLLATLKGKSSFDSFEQFALANFDSLRRFMRLKGVPPNRYDFSALFNALDPKQMDSTLEFFVNPMREALPDGQFAIDSEVLRSTFAGALKRSPLHRVQVFLPGVGLAFGQAKTSRHSDETTAIPSVLDMLDLDGRLVTAHSPHTRRDLSARIVEEGGDYVIPVRCDQNSLHKDAQLLFGNPEALKQMDSYRRDDCRGFRRNEILIATVSQDVGRLRKQHDWPGLKAVGKIEAVYERKGRKGQNDQTERTVRLFFMSREILPERLMDLTWHHWKDYSRFHWVLDVVTD